MSHTLINPADSLERQNAKLLKIAETLMHRVEQNSADTGLAYAQFERAALLEEEVRARTLDLEEALAQLNLAHAQLARADAARTRFVAAASHDLLQPLSAAKLYAASLAGALQDPELRHRAELAGNALQSVEGILNALLDISRLDSGLAEPMFTAVNIGALLAQLHDELAPQATAKGLQLRVLAPEVLVRSDAGYLRRILQNLMANAIRYTERGRVLAGVRRCGAGLRIEVHDTGIGIPPDQLEKVFDEFHRLDAAARPGEGVGLGLAIVDRACRLLNHPLTLRSEPGRGTVFAVTVPLALQARPTAQAGPQAEALAMPRALVLLLENDPDLRDALTLLLESWGLEVLACPGTAEALELLAETGLSPDVLLADYQLDGTDLGSAAIRAIRARHGPCPACVITASRSGDIPAACQELEAALLHKPIDPAALRRFLQASLGTGQG